MSVASNAALAQSWTKVCDVDDLIVDGGVAALFDGRQIAIFYLPDSDKKLFALDNHDPFSKANVLSRGIVGDLKDQLVVAAPVYKQHFNLLTGVCLEKPEVRVSCYDVKLDGSDVLLYI